MNCITDKERKIIGFLHNMMIIDKQHQKVIGLVMGNCVFGMAKEPIGKLFNNKFRYLNGEIIATLEEETIENKTISQQEKAFIVDAWLILNYIQNHTCIWIEEKNNWHKNGLLFFLQPDN